MTDHICLQCVHYEGSGTPNGFCGVLSCPVWSRRPQCASKVGDLFKPLDTVGNRLRVAREAAGLSRDDVCMALDVPYRTLQNWETGQSKPYKTGITTLLAYYHEAAKS